MSHECQCDEGEKERGGRIKVQGINKSQERKEDERKAKA